MLGDEGRRRTLGKQRGRGTGDSTSKYRDIMRREKKMEPV